MLDEVDDPACVLVDDRGLVVLWALIPEAHLEALVEERHHLEPLEHRAGHELGRLEHTRIRPERHRRARTPTWGIADDLQPCAVRATIGELHPVALAVAI